MLPNDTPAAAIATLSRQLGKDNNLEVVEELDEELAATQVYGEHPILEKRKTTEILNSRVLLAN
jgi:hypothetical protein